MSVYEALSKSVSFSCPQNVAFDDIYSAVLPTHWIPHSKINRKAQKLFLGRIICMINEEIETVLFRWRRKESQLWIFRQAKLKRGITRVPWSLWGQDNVHLSTGWMWCKRKTRNHWDTSWDANIRSYELKSENVISLVIQYFV